uniref:Mediator of RNA polymerase II transcription subunit 14 n=1 Tax=Strongyloides stercoralis TaxID=6248 RepID=A0A0K0E1Q9_STRER
MSENSNSDDNGYDSKKDESFEITIPEFPFEPDDAYSYYENDNIRVKTKLEKGEKLPNLPPVPEQHAPGTIPLAILLQYVCQKINQELFSMTEVVCKTTDVGKKVSLVQFVYITKNLLSKVLAIVKWFRYFKRYRLCIPIQNFLDQQLQQYRDTADALCGIARGELTYARMPQYNIDSAIDVICGVYARLPLSIKKRFIPEPEISTQELANILTRINLAIKTRLSFVAHYLPTRIKNIITINGTVTFVVPGEFEITLTLPGETIDVKWKLLRVKILINDYEMGEGKELVHHLQLKKLHKFCQKILNKSRRPLIGVYNFLHDFCITLQFDLIFGEILNLTQGAYKNKVFISFCNVQKRYISIEYWRRGKAKKGSPTPTYQIVFSIPKKAKNGGIVVEYRPSTSFPVNFYKEFEGKPSVHDILKSAIEYNVYKKLILLKEELEKCRPKLVVKLTGDLLPKVTVNLLNINIQEEGCELSFGVNFFTGAYMCVGDELKESLLLKTIVIGLNNNIDVKKLEKCFDGIRTEFIMKKYVQSVNMLNVRLVVEKTLPSIFRKYSYFENSIKLYFQIIKEPQYYITVTFTDPKKKGLYINFFFLSTIEGKSTIIKLNPLDFYTPPKVNFQRRACLSEIGNTSNYGQKESLLQYTPHQIGAIINGIESKINMIAVCDEFLKKNVILSSVKNDCINNSPYIEIPNISKLIGSDNSKFFENMKDIILRNDSRFKHIWPLEYSLINTPIVEDFYKRDINGQGLVHLTGKKKCFHDVRSSGMLVPNVSFYEIITLALVDKMKAFSMLHKHVYQFAYAYYHYYNQYCRIKLYSYHKLIIAYGENKDQLVFLTYKANKDSFLLSFGQDLGQNFVNGDLNDWEYQNSSILWNPHNLVASFLAEKSGRKSFLLELVDYLINTTKPLTSLYNGIRHKIISSSALTQILIGESIYSEEFDIQLIPHSEYNFKVVCGRMTLEVFMYAKDYVYIKDSSYEKPKLYGLKEFLKSFGGSVIDIDTIETDEVSLEKGARSLPESKCSEIEEILRNSSSVPCYTNIDDDKNNKDMSIKDITGSDGKYREEYFSSSRDLIKISHDSFDKLLYQDSTNKPISDFRNYLYTLRSFERLTTILVHNYGKPMLGGGGLTIHYANVTHHMVKVTFSGAKKPDGTIPCNINFIIFIQPKTFKIKLKLEYIGDIQPTADEISIVEEYFEEVMKYTESPQSIYSFMNLIRMTAPKFFSCITNLMLLQRTPDPSNFYTMNFEFVSIIQRKDELIPKFVPQILINELSGRILIPITIRPQKSDYNNKANDTNNKIKLDFVWEAANNEIYIHNANDEFFKMINQKIIQFNNTVKESLECTLEACIRYILKNEIKST